ncbi:hypothetical protein GCM10011411_00050 [Aurantiacibacter arachoides]|nr:hypothetical protein GCM10011411_00050 [Aurantiacibacter arachoides]
MSGGLGAMLATQAFCQAHANLVKSSTCAEAGFQGGGGKTLGPYRKTPAWGIISRMVDISKCAVVPFYTLLHEFAEAGVGFSSFLAVIASERRNSWGDALNRRI